jgi:hypothetical protein
MVFRTAFRDTGHSWRVVASGGRTCTGGLRIIGQSTRCFPLLLRVCRCAWARSPVASYICFAEPLPACLSLHPADGGYDDFNCNCAVHCLSGSTGPTASMTSAFSKRGTRRWNSRCWKKIYQGDNTARRKAGGIPPAFQCGWSQLRYGLIEEKCAYLLASLTTAQSTAMAFAVPIMNYGSALRVITSSRNRPDPFIRMIRVNRRNLIMKRHTTYSYFRYATQAGFGTM